MLKKLFPLILISLLAACDQNVKAPTFGLIAPPLADQIYDVAAGRALASPEALSAAVAGADYLIIGEVHDNPIHHERQAQIVEAFAPKGLALEMLSRDREGQVNRLLGQSFPAMRLGPVLEWYNNGWPAWPYYGQILMAAPGAYITGGGLERETLSMAMSEGAAKAFAGRAEKYGLDQPLSAETQAAMTTEQISAHCNAIDAEAAASMVKAQRVRDASFAAALARAGDLGRGPAVLITGNGHTRADRGVPAYLQRAQPDKRIVTIAQIEAPEGEADWRRAAARDGAGVPYDYVWFSVAARRDDPCAKFKK